ncbi:MAG: redoxin domain-containing protein [Anaerolineales bacterium]
MRSAGPRFHPFLYILIGVLVGGGFGFILFWGFPGIDPPSNLPSEFEDTALGQESVPVSAEGASFGMQVGALAPDFLLEDVNGEQYRLSEMRGQVVLLNFWATWCGPCLVEMSLLDSEYQEFSDEGLLIMAINDGESADKVEQFAEENELSLPLLLDPGRVVQRLYNIRGYPSSVFVDDEGRIKFIHIGLIQKSQLSNYLEELGFDA